MASEVCHPLLLRLFSLSSPQHQPFLRALIWSLVTQVDKMYNIHLIKLNDSREEAAINNDFVKKMSFNLYCSGWHCLTCNFAGAVAAARLHHLPALQQSGQAVWRGGAFFCQGITLVVHMRKAPCVLQLFKSTGTLQDHISAMIISYQQVRPNVTKSWNDRWM